MPTWDEEIEIVKDEVSFLQSLASLDGATLLELGCGKAEFTRKLLAKSKAKSMIDQSGQMYDRFSFLNDRRMVLGVFFQF